MDARRLAGSEAPLLERLIRHWPGQCVVCRSWGPQRLCAACEQLWGRPGLRCRTCGLRLPTSMASTPQARCGRCLTQPPPLARCIAALDYGFPWAGLLQAYKFEQALHVLRPLLDQLDLALERDGAGSPADGTCPAQRICSYVCATPPTSSTCQLKPAWPMCGRPSAWPPQAMQASCAAPAWPCWTT